MCGDLEANILVKTYFRPKWKPLFTYFCSENMVIQMEMDIKKDSLLCKVTKPIFRSEKINLDNGNVTCAFVWLMTKVRHSIMSLKEKNYWWDKVCLEVCKSYILLNIEGYIKSRHIVAKILLHWLIQHEKYLDFPYLVNLTVMNDSSMHFLFLCTLYTFKEFITHRVPARPFLRVECHSSTKFSAFIKFVILQW